MPFDDWQFYVVTLAALWGAWALARTFIPARERPAKKRASLTIGGKKISHAAKTKDPAASRPGREFTG
jgi:hypothetical protein